MQKYQISVCQRFVLSKIGSLRNNTITNLERSRGRLLPIPVSEGIEFDLTIWNCFVWK